MSAQLTDQDKCASANESDLPAPLPLLERSEGRARIAFKRRHACTVIADLFQAGSAKVRLPVAHNPSHREAILLNTAGGLTDGDRFDTDVAWGAGACATVTTQAAERIYRARADCAVLNTTLHVAKASIGLWLPQETILFDGGRVRRALTANIDANARLLALEAIIFGRGAMGEIVRTGSLFERWRVRQGGKLVFADGFRIDGCISDQLARPAVLDGNSAMGTLLYVGPDAGDLVGPLRESAACTSAICGCSQVGPAVVVRVVAREGRTLRQALTRIITSALTHIDPHLQLPKVWHL